jgi:7-keto-8-aminopelargonate synthetase-like enzyme
LIDYLVNRARTFIFSTAPPPAAFAAATAGIELVKSSEGEARRSVLWQRVSELGAKLEMQSSKFRAAIIPLLVGDEAKAMELAAALLEKDIFIPAVRYPSVRRGQARLRCTMSAAHTLDQIEQLASVLKPWMTEFRPVTPQQ